MKVSELVKLGEVSLLVIVVAPPSYLKNWKSPTFGVVSPASPAVIDSSVMRKKSLLSFLETEIKDAKDSNILLS